MEPYQLTEIILFDRESHILSLYNGNTLSNVHLSDHYRNGTNGSTFNVANGFGMLDGMKLSDFGIQQPSVSKEYVSNQRIYQNPHFYVFLFYCKFDEV